MTQREAPSLGELFSDLSQQTSTLARQEVALARAEMAAKARAASFPAALVGAGGVLALGGFLALVAALIAALDLWLPLWLSAVLVGVILVGIGYLLIRQGIQAIKRIEPAPRQTITTIKEDVAWAKEQVR